MEIQAILFDVNGTLIDIKTEEGNEDIYRAIGHFLTYQGISLRRQEVREQYFQIMQHQREQSAETFAEWDAETVWRELLVTNASAATHDLSAAKLAELPRFLAELHRGMARKRLRLFPHVRATLEHLAARYTLAVVSDAQRAYAVPELRAVGVVEYFHPIIVSGDYGYRKPDSRLFQHALTALHLRPEQALFVGNDLYHDIFGAQQAGMKAILLDYQQNTPASPTILPDYTITHFDEILQAVDYFVARA